MADRSVWWRTGAGLIAWSVLALTSAVVAWAAVDVVRDNATGPVPLAVSSAEASADPSSREPTPSATATPSTTAPSPARTTSRPAGQPASPKPQVVSRTIGSAGGTLAVTCSGERARLIYATPAVGWTLAADESSSDRVRVEFVRGDQEVEVSGRCRSGQVDADVNVKGGDDGND